MSYTVRKKHEKTGIVFQISNFFGVGFDWKDEAFKKAVKDKDENIWELLEWMALGGAEKCNEAESFDEFMSFGWIYQKEKLTEMYNDKTLFSLLENPYLSQSAKKIINSFLDGSLEKKIENHKGFKHGHTHGVAKGYVYLILAENGLYKIGKAKNLTERLKPFSVHFPMKWELLHSFQSPDYSKAELKLHELFSSKRDVGEWFKLLPEDVQYIKSIQDGQL